jgi:hypothetical protein
MSPQSLKLVFEGALLVVCLPVRAHTDNKAALLHFPAFPFVEASLFFSIKSLIRDAMDTLLLFPEIII